MPENSNYYEILGIKTDAAAIDIKKAYFAAVRKYPPERFPEEFKKIREAYDTLSDPDSRSEYDTYLGSGGFGTYYKQADQAYEEGNYDRAIELLEKALELSPGNKIARNLMGFCHMEKEEYDRAVALYKKLVYEFPENPFYYYNLGSALLEKGAHKQAAEALEKVLELDRSHVQAWTDLGLCYFIQKNYVKARQVLEKGIGECGENISIYMNLVYVDVAEKNMERMVKDIARLEKLAKDDNDMKENVAWSLAELARHTMWDMPDFSAKLLAKAKKLNPDEKEIKDLHKDAVKMQKLQEPLGRLKRDPAVHSWIKDIAAGAILGHENPMSEMDLDICERLLLRNPANVLSSVNRIKLEYPEIFKAHKCFFQKILDNPAGSRVNEEKLLEDIRYMDDLAGRSPEDVPATVDDIYIPPMQRVNTAVTGRNDPCPCGSGKKYKKCCGK